MARGNQPIARNRERGAQARHRCVELRLAGMTYDQVAREVGLSRSVAYRHVKRVLEEYHQQSLANMDTLVAEECKRCDRMLMGLWPQAIRGDVQSVAAVLRIMERKAKYLGLDKPTKGAITDAEGNDLPEGGAIVVTVQEPEDVETWAARYRNSVTAEGGDDDGT